MKKPHNHLYHVVVELAENAVISGWSVNSIAAICALALNNSLVHRIESNISTVATGYICIPQMQWEWHVFCHKAFFAYSGLYKYFP